MSLFGSDTEQKMELTKVLEATVSPGNVGIYLFQIFWKFDDCICLQEAHGSSCGIISHLHVALVIRQTNCTIFYIKCYSSRRSKRVGSCVEIPRASSTVEFGKSKFVSVLN